MVHRLLVRLDASGWPQRLVGWLLRRRRQFSHGRLTRLLELPLSGATDAVCLSIATPLISTRDLFEAVAPRRFGAWRDYRVLESLVTQEQAVAVCEEMRSGTQFTLVVPVHQGFARRAFLKARVLRLACEAERARLVTVRLPNGVLLAAGTLELAPQAAFSLEVR